MDRETDMKVKSPVMSLIISLVIGAIAFILNESGFPQFCNYILNNIA